MITRLLFCLALSFLLTPGLRADESEKPADTMMLTVFLKHDQSKNLDEIREILEKQGFYQAFPPEGTKIVTWHVLMGIGQVVTLEFPASLLRQVNVALEKTAWGAFQTEFYATYDLYPVIKERHTHVEKVKP